MYSTGWQRKNPDPPVRVFCVERETNIERSRPNPPVSSSAAPDLDLPDVHRSAPPSPGLAGCHYLVATMVSSSISLFSLSLLPPALTFPWQPAPPRTANLPPGRRRPARGPAGGVIRATSLWLRNRVCPLASCWLSRCAESWVGSSSCAGCWGSAAVVCSDSAISEASTDFFAGIWSIDIWP
jgi:hypothetical protein